MGLYERNKREHPIEHAKAKLEYVRENPRATVNGGQIQRTPEFEAFMARRIAEMLGANNPAMTSIGTPPAPPKPTPTPIGGENSMFAEAERAAHAREKRKAAEREDAYREAAEREAAVYRDAAVVDANKAARRAVANEASGCGIFGWIVGAIAVYHALFIILLIRGVMCANKLSRMFGGGGGGGGDFSGLLELYFKWWDWITLWGDMSRFC